MQKIIKWCKQIVAIQKTPQRNLTLEEQISLIKSCKYRKIVRVIKKQSFDDVAVIKLLGKSSCENDKYYKLGVSYYQKYNFSNKVKLYLLENVKSSGVVNFIYLFIDDYQMAYKKPSFLNLDEYRELFGCCDDAVIDFFRKIKPLLACLDNIQRIKIQNQQLEDLLSEMDAQGTYIMDSEPIRRDGYVYQNQQSCRREVNRYYPAFSVVLKILASGNSAWINTLILIIERTNDVWKEVFGLTYKEIPNIFKNI